MVMGCCRINSKELEIQPTGGDGAPSARCVGDREEECLDGEVTAGLIIIIDSKRTWFRAAGRNSSSSSRASVVEKAGVLRMV